ncbi:protein BREAKING OF ASYMMETRY IN THE STOMATAL LINEAGE-like [Durio zibethinus]|uniref:Protein BREAKING OF ASYMMETRY IN THE STOMATAL LINEAGE-like n=1 Tax=Durio zibethinus TaxID=66656 RepID=A0A6P6BFE2_DURZI|nr:protein BREAKING OF ASYMMETRY IN THE STOMATAL LINEAGE-like [Durio zibethinus]
MCTPWTLTRFVRWRVRDLASCFLACRCPLEEEPEAHLSSSPPQLRIRNMVFETKDDTRDKKSNRRLSRQNRCDTDRQINLSPTVSRNTGSVENGSDNSSWPRFSDEEYIVFCFREDGAFDVVKDNKESEESNQSSRSSRPVNRKLNCAEDAERDKHCSDDGRTNEDGIEGEIIPAKEGDGVRSSISCEVELASGRLRRRHQVEEKVTPNGGTVSVESSDTNQSDCSTGSFAFPVLGWEWSGSPVQMPKSESMNPRKNKALSVRFHCFRF